MVVRMKKLTEELLMKIIRSKSQLVDVPLKWSDVWNTEEELIEDLLRVCAGDNLRSGFQVQGYKYIESFKSYYMLNGYLTPKQMNVLKRNLAPEIAYCLYARNAFVIDGKPLTFEEEGLVFKPLSYNFMYETYFQSFREYLQLNFVKGFSEIEYVVLSDDVDCFTLTLGAMTYNYPNEPDDFEFIKEICFDKSTLECLSDGISDTVGEGLTKYVKRVINSLKIVGPVDILCLDFSRGNKSLAGICHNKEKKDFFDEEWKLSNYVVYIKIADRGYTTKMVHISEIKPGDVIICPDGVDRTVGKNDIKENSFMGRSIFGDSYHSGYKKVKKVVYPTFN